MLIDLRGLHVFNVMCLGKSSSQKNKYCTPSKHTHEIHFKNQVKNNNIQERLNGEFRVHKKTFRDLKKDDSPAISRLQMYHNYLLHMDLDGDTPALRIGIEIKDKNPIITVIQNATIKN